VTTGKLSAARQKQVERWQQQVVSLEIVALAACATAPWRNELVPQNCPSSFSHKPADSSFLSNTHKIMLQRHVINQLIINENKKYFSQNLDK
jgi:hypothetical protein